MNHTYAYSRDDRKMVSALHFINEAPAVYFCYKQLLLVYLMNANVSTLVGSGMCFIYKMRSWLRPFWRILVYLFAFWVLELRLERLYTYWVNCDLLQFLGVCFYFDFRTYDGSPHKSAAYLVFTDMSLRCWGSVQPTFGILRVKYC